MQVSQFLFEFDMIMCGAGNVARAPGTGAHVIDGFVHCRKDNGMLAHTKVVIGTPDGDFTFTTLPAVKGTGEPAPDAADIGKFSVTAFCLQPANGLFQNAIIALWCHGQTLAK